MFLYVCMYVCMSVCMCIYIYITYGDAYISLSKIIYKHTVIPSCTVCISQARLLRTEELLILPSALSGSFRKLGVPYFGVLIIRILLFRVLYEGSLFSKTPKWANPTLNSGLGQAFRALEMWLRVTVEAIQVRSLCLGV